MVVDPALPVQQEEGEPLHDAKAYEALLQFLYVAPIGLVQLGNEGAVDFMNPRAVNLLLPLSPDANLDNLFDILEVAAPQLRQAAANFTDRYGEVCEPLLLALASGATAASRMLSVSLIRLDANRMMAVLRDATDDVRREQRSLRRQLSEAALVDSVTAIASRTAVLAFIEQDRALAQETGERNGAILFINCDRFKQINDSLGYAVGNELLALIASRLRASLRTSNRHDALLAHEPFAARLGGDEFAIVLDSLLHEEEAALVAQRILALFEQPFSLRTHQLRCSVSIGVLMRAQFSGDADAVLQDASIAMVSAKRAGGARYAVFQPSMRSAALQRADMEGELRLALAEDQLFVVYQPVIGFKSGASEADDVDYTVGVEALVRWRHPTRGIIGPLDFIGLAEDCGLIGRLGCLVLEAACRQFVLWRDSLGVQAPRVLAVNLSRGQLVEPDFAASVASILAHTGMNAAQLQLEVTESLAAQDVTVQRQLHELKALGLTLALDDFGTGYSSLSSLHLLPVDTVKIDRSFVSEVVTSAHHRVLVEATIRVAGSLSMSTVAEGIEDAAQARLLRDLGCDKGQGYFFSRPLTGEQLAHWARSRASMSVD